MIPVFARLDDLRDMAGRLLGHGGAAATSGDVTTFDPLTGLPAEPVLARHLERLIGAASERGDRFSVAMVEVDGIDAYAASHGEAARDRCLLFLADLCRKRARREMDLVVACGPGRFSIIHHDVDKRQAMSLADSLRRAFAAASVGPDADLLAGASLSIGVATVAGESLAAAAIAERARRALDQARAAGGGAVVAI